MELASHDEIFFFQSCYILFSVDFLLSSLGFPFKGLLLQLQVPISEALYKIFYFSSEKVSGTDSALYCSCSFLS